MREPCPNRETFTNSRTSAGQPVATAIDQRRQQDQARGIRVTARRSRISRAVRRVASSSTIVTEGPGSGRPSSALTIRPGTRTNSHRPDRLTQPVARDIPINDLPGSCVWMVLPLAAPHSTQQPADTPASFRLRVPPPRELRLTHETCQFTHPSFFGRHPRQPIVADQRLVRVSLPTGVGLHVVGNLQPGPWDRSGGRGTAVPRTPDETSPGGRCGDQQEQRPERPDTRRHDATVEHVARGFPAAAWTRRCTMRHRSALV